MNRRGLVWMVLLGLLAQPALADLTPPPVHALDVDGALLVGTYPAAIGKVDDGDPLPDAGADPVSRASWPFATQYCYVYLHAIVAYRSVTSDGLGLDEEALLRVRLVDANGTVLADWFATGGRLERVYDEALATNTTYTLEVHHMVGPRVEYDLGAWLHHACPDL